MKEENRKKIKRGISYQDLLSICIGKAFANQESFRSFLGEYRRWDTDVTQGVLVVGEKVFEVEYIGTTAKGDSLWYTAEQEQVIPDAGIKMMLKIKKFLREKDIPEFYFPRAELSPNLNEHDLAMIFCMLAEEKVCYFNGSGEVSIFMFVKNLPEDIFKPVPAQRFFQIVMHIVQNYPVNAKEMIESFLIENETEYLGEENKITAFFEDHTEIEFQFKENQLVKVKGNLNSDEEETLDS